MDLAGSVCNSFLAFILPVMVLIYFKSKTGELTKFEKWLHIALATIGVILSAITITVAIGHMAGKHGHKHKHFPNPLL